MKILKTVLLFNLAIFAVTSLQAQVSLGIKAGANMSMAYGSPEEVNGENLEGIGFRPGFQVGITAGIGLTESFKIQGELNFENRNGLKTVDVTTVAPTPAGDAFIFTSVEAKNSFNYINIPVLAVIGTGKLRAYVGPNFAFLLSAKSTQTATTTLDIPEGVPAELFPPAGSTETEVDFKNDTPFDENGSFINEFDLGANIGIMFQLTEKAHLDLRVNHGLTDSTNNDYDTSLVDGSKREDSDRNVSIQLSVGLSF